MTAGSAGNHAQALAFAAGVFGVPCDIFVPAGAPITKIEACRAYGATVVEGGASLDEAMSAARARAADAGMAFCHPFDDPAVVAGQGTIGLELVEDVADLSCVVVPLGGGGLAAGTAIAVKSLLPHVARGRRAGRRVRALRRRHVPGRAGGHAGRRHRGQAPGRAHRAARRHVGGRARRRRRGRHRRCDGPVDGPGEAVRRGRRRGRRRGGRRRARHTGAARRDVRRPVGRQRRPRDRARPHPAPRDARRAAPRRVRPHRRPARAAWSGCSASFAAAGANLVEVQHQREGVDLHVRETGVHATFEVRGRDHAQRVLDAVRGAGYPDLQAAVGP